MRRVSEREKFNIDINSYSRSSKIQSNYFFTSFSFYFIFKFLQDLCFNLRSNLPHYPFSTQKGNHKKKKLYLTLNSVPKIQVLYPNKITLSNLHENIFFLLENNNNNIKQSHHPLNIIFNLKIFFLPTIHFLFLKYFLRSFYSFLTSYYFLLFHHINSHLLTYQSFNHNVKDEKIRRV